MSEIETPGMPDLAEDAAREDGLTRRPDGRPRCRWHGGLPDYVSYHDEEWGRPTRDDDRLFEKLCLEGFQAGLSWLTILRKREAFRAAFQGFAIERVAAMTAGDVDRLVLDAGIVRHRAKIVSAINNAGRVQAMRAEGLSFSGFLWSFEPGPEERPAVLDIAYLKTNTVTPASTRLSKALKARGFTFVGPTTIYAFLQSMGFVNDHIEGCIAREACEAERAALVRPGLRAGSGPEPSHAGGDRIGRGSKPVKVD